MLLVCVPVVERDEVTSQPLVIDLVLLVQDQEYQVEPEKHKFQPPRNRNRKSFSV
jgi:hypothetical protein